MHTPSGNKILRSRDVVNCLAERLSNRDIATRLAISLHTVKNYMFKDFRKSSEFPVVLNSYFT
jgi:DNA-binding CsgD family transcriptional regulator